MTWDQIKEINKESFAIIGHHSHTHEYLIEKTNEEFIKDIETANLIFKENLDIFQNYFLIHLVNILNL